MTVSVVLATYNGEKFLREQFDSLFGQTLMPDEIIVADDRSTDATWDIIMEYKTRFPNLFVVYQNEKRLGPHANFKNAFKYAKCDLIAPCDQDDIWFPEKLERSVKAIDDGYEFALCQEVIQYELSGRKEIWHSMPALKYCIFGCPVAGHLIVFKRELLDVFDIAPEITFDWGLLLMAASRNSGVAIDYVGCIWRRHKSAVTSEYSDYGGKKLEHRGKWYKFFKTIKMLSRGEKSKVIAKRMKSNAAIIGVCQGKDKEVRLAYKVASLMSNQTVFSLVKASFDYMFLNRIHEDYRQLSLKAKIGNSLYAFCYPAVWWYDYHNHDAL